MGQAGYGAEITKTVQGLPYGTPIRTEDIAQMLASRFAIPYDKARGAANVKLKRMADRGEISRVQKGLYCHVKQTPFGPLTPDMDTLLIKKLTICHGERIGYPSGAALFNQWGLASLLPKRIEITTNQWASCLPSGSHLVLKRPPERVTEDNWKYLQFVDAIERLQDAFVDAESPVSLLQKRAEKQGLDILKLIFIARRIASAKTVLRIVDMFAEGKNETAS